MSILIKPIITEKATAQSEDLNVYAFEVARSANKVEIKKAVEEFYGVNVETVRTAIVPAKFQTKLRPFDIVCLNRPSWNLSVL